MSDMSREHLIPEFTNLIKWYDKDGVSRILDVGCGTLHQSFKRIYGERYTSLDLSSTPFPKSVPGDAHDLSMFHDDSFDIVTMWSVIEHLKEPYKALSEAIRVAKTVVTLSTDFTERDKNMSDNHYYSWTQKTLNHLLSEFGESKTWVAGNILWGVIKKCGSVNSEKTQQ